jgi:phosphate transport system substrate-binding protein
MKTNQSSIQETALSFTLCAFIALAACSKPGSKDAGHNADASLQGTLLLTGSSTMAPLISDIAKRFELAIPTYRSP